jgi:hypothetical protein
MNLDGRIMWLLVTRESRPDAPYWPGRRWLAAVDAVVWPAHWGAALGHLQRAGGSFVPVAVVVLKLNALVRLHRALLENHRYRFTACRWARGLVGALALGCVLKVLLAL